MRARGLYLRIVAAFVALLCATQAAQYCLLERTGSTSTDARLAVFALSLLATIAWGVLVARGIVKPLHRLAASAQRIAAGDYAEADRIERHDEIGDLATALDHMRAQVEERESRIRDLAYRDPLTGLPNRTLFTDRLHQAMATARRMGRPLTVVMMDLDRFKHVNDSLGRQGGDHLLVAVAARLRDALPRASDTLAHMGSDEFAVLLPTEDANTATAVIRKLQQALDAPILIDDQLVDTRASLGIASYPEHGDTLPALLHHADASMELAKRNGTGFAVHDPRYGEDSPERLSLLSELRQAVEKNELVLHFQPKLHLDGSGTLSVEALLRWQHAERGFVLPDQFIPFAEQTGYITTITTWVINTALTHLKGWRKDGLAIEVAINISTRDLMSANFPALVASMLERHRCEAAWLVFEITETALIDDPTQAQVNIDQLHALGCRISIDDFGTGYSSLGHLRRLKVDELKIDRSFVMGMVNDPGDANIVRSTIDLAHNMGLKVVAEGVETDAVLHELEAMGCDMAQGYLLTRALPATELLAWIAQSPRLVRTRALSPS